MRKLKFVRAAATFGFGVLLPAGCMRDSTSAATTTADGASGDVGAAGDSWGSPYVGPGVNGDTSADVGATEPATTATVEAVLGSSSDDAEESSEGTVELASQNLDLGNLTEVRTVGLRFAALSVPKDAVIRDAYVQFEANETTTGAAALWVAAEAVDDAPTFAATRWNLSTRARTTTAIAWAPVGWPQIGAAGLPQRTSDLRALVQELVNRTGWQAGNAVAILVSGTGSRPAATFDRNAYAAATLHVTYALAVSGNAAPVVFAGDDTSLTLPAKLTLSGSATDDGLPAPATLTTSWAIVSGPAPVDFADPTALVTTAAFTRNGTYLLRLTAADGASAVSDDIAVSVDGGVVPIVPVFDARIAAAADDAEESIGGAVSLTSSDLELVDDDGEQTVGLRFPEFAVPNGAKIKQAYLQFETDETGSAPTSLTIRGQASSDAEAFSVAKGDLSRRALTDAVVSWSPASWDTVGAAGSEQRSPDLASVIEEIVGRNGWDAGHALALMITGTGLRTAVAYDWSAESAPVLHVELAE